MPEEQNARDERAVRDFVEHMAMTLAYWGFPRMPGRVLVAMMSADEDSLTASDLSERLAVSPAAISGAVRYLVQFGLLERAPAPGSRRDHYRMPDGAWYEASVTKGGVLKALADVADGGVSALGGATTPAGARVAEMRDFFRFVQDELDDLLTRWRATKTELDAESVTRQIDLTVAALTGQDDSAADAVVAGQRVLGNASGDW